MCLSCSAHPLIDCKTNSYGLIKYLMYYYVLCLIFCFVAIEANCDWFSNQLLHENKWLFINYCFHILHVCMCIYLHSLRCRVDVTPLHPTSTLLTTFLIIDQCPFPLVSSFSQTFLYLFDYVLLFRLGTLLRGLAEASKHVSLRLSIDLQNKKNI